VNIRLVTLPGDGVGPEVIPIAVEILRRAVEGRGHQLDVDERLIGWIAREKEGTPLSDETVRVCLEADAVLLGAVGSPAADRVPAAERPEAGLLRLRSELGCYANLRPAIAYAPIVDCSPLHPEVVTGTDLMIVRELAGGLYYGKSGITGSGNRRRATDTETYSVTEIKRIAKYAFDLARSRKKRVTSVDKANVLTSSRLWREIVTEVGGGYADVQLSHMLVDRAAMELVLRPRIFDVMLMSNLFGDILSDEAAGVVGSIGLLGSASLGGKTDLYEPVHGSAPDIAGQDKANPIGAIISVAMMLRHTFRLEKEARAVESALDRVLSAGLRTPDIQGKASSTVGTQAFGKAVLEALAEAHQPAISGRSGR
jgi:3-isopropylmalate dehydrogenase